MANGNESAPAHAPPCFEGKAGGPWSCPAGSEAQARAYTTSLVLGLAPTVSTTSAVCVWHDGTQARLLQVRELARLQGLPDNFVLPEGRVVATRLIGNAVPPALIRALLL